MITENYTVILGNYKGLTFRAQPVEVTPEEAEALLQQELQNHSVPVAADKAAENGDTVLIDFMGFCDGVQFEGGTAQNYELELGSNSFIPGFESQLVGTRAGQEKDVFVLFPTQYQASNLAGKKARFHCVIHEVKHKETPELTDDFARQTYGIETVDALREAITNAALRSKADEERNRIMNELMTRVVEQSNVVLMPAYLEAQTDRMLQYYAGMLQQQGASLAMFYQMTGRTEAELRAELRTEAEKNAMMGAVLAAIAREENLQVTDEEIDGELARMAQQYGVPTEQIRAAMDSNPSGRQEIESGILNSKALNVVLASAVPEEI